MRAAATEAGVPLSTAYTWARAERGLTNAGETRNPTWLEQLEQNWSLYGGRTERAVNEAQILLLENYIAQHQAQGIELP